MIRPFPAGDQYLPQNLDDVFARAIEGDSYHTAIEAAPADVSATIATAGTPVDVAVAFSKPFAATPVVKMTMVGATNTATYLNVLAVNVATSGFTLRANSGVAQTVNVRWLAYGRRQ